MDSVAWFDLLAGRGVDQRIIALLTEMAAVRTLEPPTTDTEQLLVACERDGYAAGRVDKHVLSLFFDPQPARVIGDRHGFAVGQRSVATSIVRIPAAELDDPVKRQVVVGLVEEALDRVEPKGAWTRGLPDATRAQGDMCPIHFMQRSLTGECPMCA